MKKNVCWVFIKIVKKMFPTIWHYMLWYGFFSGFLSCLMGLLYAKQDMFFVQLHRLADYMQFFYWILPLIGCIPPIIYMRVKANCGELADPETLASDSVPLLPTSAPPPSPENGTNVAPLARQSADDTVSTAPVTPSAPKRETEGCHEPPDPHELFIEKEAAEYIGKSVTFLRRDRSDKMRRGVRRGPRYLRDGRRVYYSRSDLKAWLRERHQVPQGRFAGESVFPLFGDY